MSDLNFAAGIVRYACPICGKDSETSLIMNQISSKNVVEQINQVHNKIVGYSKNACSECEKHKDKVVFMIEVDGSKSTPTNPYRTGRIYGINKNCPIFDKAGDFILTTDNGVRYMFADISAFEEFGLNKS